MVFKPFYSQLEKDFKKDFSRVEGFYEYPPRGESLPRRGEKMQQFPRRDLLVQVLRDYNTRIGAPDPVFENIDLLADKDTTVVIGGQQAGLFTGPLLTIYKALDIIARAEQASRETGRPVVPVFWVAGEDHDFREINHLWLINQENQVEKIALDSSFRTRPASLIPRKASFLEAIKDLEKKTAPGRFKDEYLKLLYSTGEQAETFGEWFSRILVNLLGHRGLIIFDPLARGTEELKKDFISLFKSSAENFSQELIKKEEELEIEGYHVQVKKDARHANFFLILNGERRPVFFEEGRFKSRGGDLDLDEKTLWEMLEKDPVSFSPDALLRPVFQDFVFPVLASVNGPGELAYQAQLASGYRSLGLEQPVLFPRREITLVEEGLLRHLDKWGVTPLQVIEEQEELRDRLIARQTGLDIEEAFSRTRSEIRENYRGLIEDLNKVHPNLEDLGEKNMKRILHEVEYLQKRALEFQREKENNLCQQFAKVLVGLFPNGKKQERVLNVFPFLMKYGPELLAIMERGLEELEEEHGFLTTGGKWR